MAEWAIEADGLTKRYGEVTSLIDVCLTVPRASVLAVLGHNGAGKTTLIDILSTRVKPTAGVASVCGFDVGQQARRVRRAIGVVGQFAAVDDALSGRDNLQLVARLLGANRRQAGGRAVELVAAFDLGGVADRPARTYSGGLRRRLDIAMSLVGAPQVLFLDEPTTGLDPVSRSAMWRTIEELGRNGTTIVLTTQYLEEADRLADHVVVLGLGRVAVSGTPAQLKARLGNKTAMLRFPSEVLAYRMWARICGLGMRATRYPGGCEVVVALADPADVTDLVRAADVEGAPLLELKVTEPTLDEVYLSVHDALAAHP